jgi:hypothetical protein
MTATIIFIAVLSFFMLGESFNPINVKRVNNAFRTQRLNSNSLSGSGFNVAELFSGPAARYNGELIDKSLKIVDKVPKPDGYEYGAVSADSVAPLIASLVLIVSVAAIVPYFLSIGETALKQQRERELTDGTTDNKFTLKARQEKEKKK